MRPHRYARRALMALAFSLASVLPSSVSADPSLPPSASPIAETHVPSCTKGDVGTASCFALRRTDAHARGAAPAKQPSATPDVLGNNGAYDPSFLQSAYVTPSASSGSGQTIAIVDAYDAPNAEADLGVYRSQFSLLPCTAANGCFRKVNQAGSQGPYPAADGGWAQEISLDLDMASAICPNCKLLLVEANSNSLADLGEAVNTAVRLGASVVSNSYGAGEFSGQTAYAAYYDHPGIPIVVSSGDSGYGVQFPAALPTVTAVGGTTLNQATGTGTRNATETVWSGAGSGCSRYAAKPAWQKDAGCAGRTVADTAAVADPGTGVWAYDSYAYQGQSGWLVFGGTSVAAPIVASLYALAGGSSPSSVAYPASYPYASGGTLNDITSGNNGSCGTYLCSGGTGYDGPTGLGTPNGTSAFAPSATLSQGYSVAAGPASASTTAGGSTAYTLTLTASGGYSAPVDLGVSGLPGGTATFSANPVIPTSAGARSSLTVTTSASTPAGTYPLKITATGRDSAATSQSTTVSLVVKGEFSLSATPSSQTVIRGGSTSYALDVSTQNGYAGPVQLSVSGVPSHASASFSLNPATPGVSGTKLTVSTGRGTPAGTYVLLITGSGSDGTTHQTTASLTVR